MLNTMLMRAKTTIIVSGLYVAFGWHFLTMHAELLVAMLLVVGSPMAVLARQKNLNDAAAQSLSPDITLQILHHVVTLMFAALIVSVHLFFSRTNGAALIGSFGTFVFIFGMLASFRKRLAKFELHLLIVPAILTAALILVLGVHSSAKLFGF